MNRLYQKLEDVNPKELKNCIFQDMIVDAYCYNCYDGDTIRIIFDYKGEYIKYSCRVDRIDTPEMRSKCKLEKKYAKKAKQYLSDLVLNKVIKVKINGFDKYGRLLVDLYKKDSDENINDMMVMGGYAKKYEGGTKEKWVFE